MIRFSAALVAVAIGVLIGGIATSKLLLVYIAIVVSAVALLALAIGVVLKREELFGEGQGLVPAGVGAAPSLPARAGESQDQLRPAVSVPPSAPFQGPTAGHGAAVDGTAVDGTAQAAPPVTAAPHQASHGQGRDRVAAPAPPWEAQSARDQWSSSSWQGSPEPGSPVADPAPDWMPGGRGASDPAGQARPAASPPPPPPPASPAPSGPSSAGPGPASPNWFAPQARPADVASPATEAPADAASADEDDDWPARYSWLDDEADESSGGADQNDVPADQAAGEDASDAARESESPAQAGQAPDPAGEAPGPGNAAAAPVAADAGPEPGPAPTEPEPAPTEPVPESAEPEAASPDSEAPSAGTQDVVSGDALVAVLQGVPRYHQPDCVLIRFMPGDDILRLPAEQAKADGCTPCAACQPAD